MSLIVDALRRSRFTLRFFKKDIAPAKGGISDSPRKWFARPCHRTGWGALSEIVCHEVVDDTGLAASKLYMIVNDSENPEMVDLRMWDPGCKTRTGGFYQIDTLYPELLLREPNTVVWANYCQVWRCGSAGKYFDTMGGVAQIEILGDENGERVVEGISPIINARTMTLL